MAKKKPCKLCGSKTEFIMNINFKAIPICDGCASAIMLQQAQWLAEQNYERNKNER